jgi:hypothetical protein
MDWRITYIMVSLEWSSSDEDDCSSVGSLSSTGTDDSKWEVVSVFELPKMRDDASMISAESIVSSVRSSQNLRNLLKVPRSRAGADDDSTPNDGITQEESTKGVEESIERVEEALAVFKQHAQRLGIEEADLFRAVQNSYTSGKQMMTPIRVQLYSFSTKLEDRHLL